MRRFKTIGRTPMSETGAGQRRWPAINPSSMTRGGLLSLLAICLCVVNAEGQEQVRYYEQGGVTYRETRQNVQHPVRDVQYQDSQQTFYRQQVTTRYQDYSQLSYQPVTNYQWEPRWHGWWRIFRGPHVAYHLVPHTSWQATAHTVRVPVAQTDWVPETRTVRRAVPTLRMVEQEQVTRVAVGPAANQSAAVAPAAPPLLSYQIPPAMPQLAGGAYTYPPAYTPPAYGGWGGVARMSGDPPRGGATYQDGSAATRLR